MEDNRQDIEEIILMLQWEKRPKMPTINLAINQFTGEFPHLKQVS